MLLTSLVETFPEKKALLAYVSQEKIDPLMSPLFAACRGKNLNGIQYLVETCQVPLTQSGKEDNFNLFWALLGYAVKDPFSLVILESIHNEYENLPDILSYLKDKKMDTNGFYFDRIGFSYNERFDSVYEMFLGQKILCISSEKKTIAIQNLSFLEAFLFNYPCAIRENAQTLLTIASKLVSLGYNINQPNITDGHTIMRRVCARMVHPILFAGLCDLGGSLEIKDAEGNTPLDQLLTEIFIIEPGEFPPAYNYPASLTDENSNSSRFALINYLIEQNLLNSSNINNQNSQGETLLFRLVSNYHKLYTHHYKLDEENALALRTLIATLLKDLKANPLVTLKSDINVSSLAQSLSESYKDSSILDLLPKSVDFDTSKKRKLTLFELQLPPAKKPKTDDDVAEDPMNTTGHEANKRR